MRKFFLLFFLVLVLIVPSAVFAQETLKFEVVSVDLWPEYDNPAVLVVYKILLPADTVLPTNISIRIPAQAEINAVAIGGEDGALINAPYTKEISGDWLELTFSATSLRVQIEYYDSLTMEDSRRLYLYQWPGDYAVDSFSIVFQQPVDSTDLNFSPSPDFLGVDPYNLSYYLLDSGSIGIGQRHTFSFEYQKSTDRLSATGIQVQPIEPLNGNGSSGTTLTDFWQQVVGFFETLDIKYALIILAGVIGILVVVVVAIVMNKRRAHPASKSRERHKAHGGSGESSSPEGPYCTQCGRRGQPGDQFCRVCGTRLKREG